jgi:2-C-methyl-D-erythritol 4-phosphate cytidylyltransferase
MRTVAVVLAGGSGRRFGSGRPKQLRELAGRNLIEYCVRAFDQAPAVDEVLVVVAPDIEDEVRQETAAYRKVAGVILGGSSRTDSTRQAIGWLATATRASDGPASSHDPAEQDLKVLFHDAARPLVDQRTIADVVAALDQWLAVGVVVPSADTIVEIADGAIRRVLTRDSLARCQTPQGFRLSVISRAYELADGDPGFAAIPATDDCGVVLRYLPGVPVGVVRGSERNLKITYAADLAVAQALLEFPGEAGTGLS